MEPRMRDRPDGKHDRRHVPKRSAAWLVNAVLTTKGVVQAESIVCPCFGEAAPSSAFLCIPCNGHVRGVSPIDANLALPWLEIAGPSTAIIFPPL